MFLIAEIGQAHEGSLGLALSYIDALAETGVDAVKFQVHIAEAESSEFEIPPNPRRGAKGNCFKN